VFLKNLGAESKQADLFNANEMVDATIGCDAIFHLATHIPQKPMPKSKDWELNDRIRIQGTKHLVAAAVKNKIEVFVCESIAAIYGQQNGNFVFAETPIPQNQIKMLESAVEMEDIIRQTLTPNYLIFRFGHFYAADSFHTKDLIQKVSKGKMPMLGKGDFYWNMVHIDDAADSIVFGLDNFQKLKGRAFDLSDFNPLLFSDLLNKLAEITGGKKAFSYPLFVAKMILGKNAFAFLTNSYRLKKDPLLKDWQPKHFDFVVGIGEIVKRA
jgi:nucleoside-diphosphate-sugar epimerase